jgi:hypothetical protein
MFQRIDDQREIDSSFVTCAEYQLFLDEMKSEGKYHQPEHWMDFSFLKGHAKNPITGMRYEDAESFCAWLTRIKGQKYRLPNEDEIKLFPIEHTILLVPWEQNRKLLGLDPQTEKKSGND